MAPISAWHPQRSLPLLLLLLTLATPCVRASSEHRRVEAPAAVSPGSARQEFHVAPVPPPAPGSPGDEAPAASTKNGAARRRPVREWRRSRSRARRGRGAGGTGTWTFSAMLPRGFVPPSGSSACHNDIPATAADAHYFACSGAGTP